MNAFSIETANYLDAQREVLACSIVDQLYELHLNLASQYGPAGKAKCEEDTATHLRYLSESIRVSHPVLFADYVAWAQVLLNGKNIATEGLIQNLHLVRDVLQNNLPSDMANVVTKHIEYGLDRITDTPCETVSFLNADAPLHDISQKYLAALLSGNRQSASQLILKTVESGTPIKDIYLHVFQETQYEIGRLWQENQVTVAQEHYCTAATQLIMSQLYAHIFNHEKNGRSMVAACVGGDLHEIGLRMVADFYEMDGWDTYYLGANSPTDSVVQATREHQAQILAVSATMTFHIPQVIDLIKTVRQAPECEHLKILVGGYPFLIDPELWHTVGADATATNAEQAIAISNQFSS